MNRFQVLVLGLAIATATISNDQTTAEAPNRTNTVEPAATRVPKVSANLEQAVTQTPAVITSVEQVVTQISEVATAATQATTRTLEEASVVEQSVTQAPAVITSVEQAVTQISEVATRTLEVASVVEQSVTPKVDTALKETAESILQKKRNHLVKLLTQTLQVKTMSSERLIEKHTRKLVVYGAAIANLPTLVAELITEPTQKTLRFAALLKKAETFISGKSQH